MIGKLKININCTEQELIESLLNQFHSGFSDIKWIRFTLAMASLGQGWHIDKLEYYLNMFGEAEA